jgi:hypothetical protein
MLRLTLFLVVCVPTFALLGALASLNAGRPPAWGLVAGDLVFGGSPRWKLWTRIFGPEPPKE